MLILTEFVPEQAIVALKVCIARYRIHSMYGPYGSGAHFESKYKRWQDGTAPSNWERHDGFNIDWGLRPINVERDGFISLSASWRMRGRAKNYTFHGFGASFNFPGHTMQYGPRMWEGTKEAKYARFMELLEGELTSLFIDFGEGDKCYGSCSHIDPTLKDGEVLIDPGLTNSGKPALIARVW